MPSGLHYFSKFAARFSAKAAMPSFWSGVAKVERKRRRSRRRPSARLSSSAAFTASLHIITDGLPSAAIFSASASASSTSASGAWTDATRPAASASSAPICSPVRHMRMALDLPIARTSRCVPPAPGIVPSRISGWPNLAAAPQIMMSHIMASSQPPPSANPFTAAIVGVRSDATSCHDANMSSAYVAGNVLSFISLMSAPAAKARSEPVRTMQPTDGSASHALVHAFTSAMSGPDSALSAFGRFSVTSPTPPRCSARMCS
mmetsp:Transcript_18997/g.58481  ORF Transcript_18997/g.58481 Transcript_18997/m.58481 type:complete len:261 (-) Transcript_18997:124-906(-)